MIAFLALIYSTFQISSSKPTNTKFLMTNEDIENFSFLSHMLNFYQDTSDKEPNRLQDTSDISRSLIQENPKEPKETNLNVDTNIPGDQGPGGGQTSPLVTNNEGFKNTGLVQSDLDYDEERGGYVHEEKDGDQRNPGFIQSVVDPGGGGEKTPSRVTDNGFLQSPMDSEDGGDLKPTQDAARNTRLIQSNLDYDGETGGYVHQEKDGDKRNPGFIQSFPGDPGGGGEKTPSRVTDGGFLQSPMDNGGGGGFTQNQEEGAKNSGVIQSTPLPLDPGPGGGGFALAQEEGVRNTGLIQNAVDPGPGGGATEENENRGLGLIQKSNDAECGEDCNTITVLDVAQVAVSAAKILSTVMNN